MRKRYTGKEVAPVNVPRPVIQNEKLMEHVRNGLGDTILGFTPGVPFGQMVSQADTLFANERWYLISNMRQLLSQMYVEHGIIQTLVNVPVDDALRGGIKIKTKQLDDDEIKHLEMDMVKHGDIETIGWGMKWTRLFGGGGVLILTDQDPAEPFSLDQITEDQPLEFRGVDLWEMFWDKQGDEGFNPAIELPSIEYYSYYGVKVHKSRFMRMTGLKAPSFVRPRLRGWGFSVVEGAVRSINQYLKSVNLTFEVLDEFKVDVFGIKNLTNTLASAQGTQKVRERIALANQQKNFQHALIMDSEDTWDQKQITFTGLADAQAGVRMQLASDWRMPLTKLFGISAAGFNSGEDDIEVYNGMVESEIRAKMHHHLWKAAAIRCWRHYKIIPDDLDIEFKPLRILSSEQEETVKSQKHTRLLSSLTAGAIDVEEFREACNRDNLLPIQVDPKKEMLLPEEGDGEEGEDKPNKPESKKGKETKTKTPEAKESKEPKEA